MSQNKMAAAKNSLTSSGASVKNFGMSVDSDGKESFFATVGKSQDIQKKRIEKKAAEKKEQKIRDKKKAEKKERDERKSELIGEVLVIPLKQICLEPFLKTDHAAGPFIPDFPGAVPIDNIR